MASGESKKINWKGFANFLAFVAVVLVGLALILSQLPFIKETAVGPAISLIAQALAYSLVSYYAFLYARSKRSWVYIVIWIVALVLIAVSIGLVSVNI